MCIVISIPERRRQELQQTEMAQFAGREYEVGFECVGCWICEYGVEAGWLS